MLCGLHRWSQRIPFNLGSVCDSGTFESTFMLSAIGTSPYLLLASFVHYLIELIGGKAELVRRLRLIAREDPQRARDLGDHGYFLNQVLKPWNLGDEFLLQCHYGVFQYVAVKTLTTVRTFFF